jgi:hypothetical protein
MNGSSSSSSDSCALGGDANLSIALKGKEEEKQNQNGLVKEGKVEGEEVKESEAKKDDKDQEDEEEGEEEEEDDEEDEEEGEEDGEENGKHDEEGELHISQRLQSFVRKTSLARVGFVLHDCFYFAVLCCYCLILPSYLSTHNLSLVKLSVHFCAMLTSCTLFLVPNYSLQLAMEVVAHTLLPEQVESLRREFATFDSGETGDITYAELHDTLQSQVILMLLYSLRVAVLC